MRRKLHILLWALCIVFLTGQLFALEGDNRGNPEIRGDDEYVGNFAGFKGNEIQVDLSRTGYRMSLPLANDVEYLHKDNNYAPFDPEDIRPEAPVKAIEVDGEIVQVIMLWLMPR